MYITIYEVIGVLVAVIAILMLGSRNLRFHVSMYTLQIWLVAAETLYFSWQFRQWHFTIIGITLIFQRAILVPGFLNCIVNGIDARKDPGMILPAPITMHLSMLLFGLSFFVATYLPMPVSFPVLVAGQGATVIASGTASISLLFSGLVMMLTRRLALSQIVGFMTMENGVYLFALTQTDGLPILIEMAVFIDILGAVMLAFVLIFNIKRSFEPIDVTRLTNLKH